MGTPEAIDSRMTQRVLSAGEKLSHARALVSRAARKLSERVTSTGTASANVLEELRECLVCEDVAKLELAEALKEQAGAQ